jgi:hypothetical protein
MGKFGLYDTVVYQGKERSITDQRGENEYRIEFNHGTHSTFDWVIEDKLSPLVEHVPLAGGTELESQLSKVIVIVLHDGTLSVDGPFKLTTLDQLRIFKAQLEEAEKLMQARLP